MQNRALDILKIGYNVFLTGIPRSGKTYILTRYIEYLKSHALLPTILIPQGTSAHYLGEQTISSYFSLGREEKIDTAFIEHLLKKEYLHRRFSKLKILIIDEISRVSFFEFNAMDIILKIFKKNEKPFGGIQVILSGDLFQLPPMLKGKKTRQFAWQTAAWDSLDLQVCYFEKRVPQSENSLTNILDTIRNGKITTQTYEILHGRMKNPFKSRFKKTTLFIDTTAVDEINEYELQSLPTKEYKFISLVEGPLTMVEKIFKSSHIQKTLLLKKNAVVMFTKDNPQKGYSYGTTGIVQSFSEKGSFPIVKLNNDKTITVGLEEWFLENDQGMLAAKISQFPLQLAWAVSIYKSEGMLLDVAQVDFSNISEVGLGYVALSRIKDIDNLELIGLNDTALRVDPLIVQKNEEMKKASLSSSKQVSIFTEKEKKLLIDTYINFVKK